MSLVWDCLLSRSIVSLSTPGAWCVGPRARFCGRGCRSGYVACSLLCFACLFPIPGIKWFGDTILTFLSTQLGLSVVPFLPYIFDHPVEEAVDWCFGTALRVYGGEDAVRPLPPHALTKASTEAGPTASAAQLSWEEYKEDRERARELRREETGGSSWTNWFGKSSGSEPKDKKD